MTTSIQLQSRRTRAGCSACNEKQPSDRSITSERGAPFRVAFRTCLFIGEQISRRPWLPDCSLSWRFNWRRNEMIASCGALNWKLLCSARGSAVSLCPEPWIRGTHVFYRESTCLFHEFARILKNSARRFVTLRHCCNILQCLFAA